MEGLDMTAIGSIATALATIALVILLYRTVKQLEVTVEVSRIQTEYRFRPWIGHYGAIKKMENSMDGDCQFDVSIKNFGELPASGVTAKFMFSEKMLTRDNIKSESSSSFNLGPMLPNMEKHYWFSIPSDVWKNAMEGKSKIFTGLFFEYVASGEKSGYGMLSEYNPTIENFVHKDMWIDDEKL
jgi:hypothetical protein